MVVFYLLFFVRKECMTLLNQKWDVQVHRG